MMGDLIGDDYTMDQIREETSEKHYGEEVHLVQPLVGQLDVTSLSPSWAMPHKNSSRDTI
jgi:hypothetical protein